MSAVFYRSRATLFLVTAGVVLGGILALEARRDIPETATPKAAPSASPGVVAEVDFGTYVAPPIEDYDEVLVRPLFVEGRTPPEASAQVDERAVPDLEGLAKFWRLEGLVLTPETRVALVRSKRDRKLLRLSEGDAFEGWEVVEFATERILLKKGEKAEELELKPAIGAEVRPAAPKRRTRTKAAARRKAEPKSTAREATGRRKAEPVSTVRDTTGS